MSAKKMTLREAINQPKLRSIGDRLRMYKARTSVRVLSEELKEDLSQLKQEAVSADDQVTAKAIWCLETIGRIQDHFVSAFLHIAGEECEEAWGELERCETEIIFLDRHFNEMPEEFGIEHARVQTKRIQELYLLEWGVSPAFIHKAIHCSICDAKLTLRSGCDHIVGEIYDGEMCAQVVKDMEILHVALVTNPAQKFSILFPRGNDDHRLVLVKFLGRTLSSPWDSWNYYKETRRQHHPLFKDAKHDDPCPCGSDRRFKQCCYGKEELFPHYEFSFEGETSNEPPVLEVYTTQNSEAENSLQQPLNLTVPLLKLSK